MVTGKLFMAEATFRQQRQQQQQQQHPLPGSNLLVAQEAQQAAAAMDSGPAGGATAVLQHPPWQLAPIMTSQQTTAVHGPGADASAAATIQCTYVDTLPLLSMPSATTCGASASITPTTTSTTPAHFVHYFHSKQQQQQQQQQLQQQGADVLAAAQPVLPVVWPPPVDLMAAFTAAAATCGTAAVGNGAAKDAVVHEMPANLLELLSVDQVSLLLTEGLNRHGVEASKSLLGDLMPAEVVELHDRQTVEQEQQTPLQQQQQQQLQQQQQQPQQPPQDRCSPQAQVIVVGGGGGPDELLSGGGGPKAGLKEHRSSFPLASGS
jgi:hypothetical protein